jgi:hypothetical protein
MWQAEATNCIAPEQAGGRRCHRANETSLNSTLVCNDSWFRRKAMAICSNDAKGCFDRIVHSVAFICLQRFGIPAGPILSMLNVIQNMTHSIRTAFGDSSITYGPALPPPHPIHGASNSLILPSYHEIKFTSGSSLSCVDKANTSDPGSGNVRSPKPSLLNQPRTSNFPTCSSNLKHHT